MSQLDNFRLVVFRAVAEHLCFRKAAEHLLLTQPAVTLQIKALEDSLFASSHAGERALNRAIVTAEISWSFEEYLEIFDRFYAEDIEVSGAASTGHIRGKARVHLLLNDFPIPLHIMAEIGGVSISIRQVTMPGDAAGETHSAWTFDLVGASGRSCTLSWRTLRRWKDSLVVYEYHYDEQQSGGPLTEDDLRFGDEQNPISQHTRELA